MQLRILPLLVTITVLCSITFLLGKCSGSGDTDSGQPMSMDSIALYKAKIANLEANLLTQKRIADQEKRSADSLKAVKPRFVTRYTTAKNSVTPGDTFGCRNLFIKYEQLVDAADSLSAVNDSIITSQERRDTALLSVISIQHDELTIKDSIIQEQAKGLETAQKDLKKANRKVRRNRVIAGACAILAGIGFAF